MDEWTPLPCFVFDPDGCILHANRAAAQLLNEQRSRLIGRRFGQFLESEEVFRAHVREVFSTRSSGSCDTVLRGSHGGALLQFVSVYVEGEGGIPSHCCSAAVEVDRSSPAHVRLRALADSLEQRVEERTVRLRQLASELTHAECRERERLARILHDDLQQVLVAGKMQISILRRHLSDPDITVTVERADELVRHALDISRSLAVELSPPVLNDAGLAAALAWLARWMRKRHGLRVDLSADTKDDPQTEDLRLFLFDAIRELLFNVVRHAEVDRASLSMAREGDMVRVTVCDAGAGFDPSATVTTHSEGLGLFSIRQRLMLFSGRMEIESIPGKGTKITLLAPDASRAVPAGSPLAESSALAEVAGGPGGPAPKRIRVMLADDHKILREGLAGLLRLEPDIDVVGEAADGQMALEMARDLKPEVIVMDVTMPRMNGIEATRRVLAEMPDICVIALSMHTEEDMADAMRRAGARTFLSKGGPSEDLVAAIRACAGPAQ